MRERHPVRYLRRDEAGEAVASQLRRLGCDECVAVPSLHYVYAPESFYGLAPRRRPPLERVAAFLIDMDGTSTTTEPLALHALEWMVRRITGRTSPRQWPGLDERIDHPNVIGNSNFRHVEFLVGRYRDALDPPAACQAFIEAALWTWSNLDDPQRRRAVRTAARNCGLAALLDDAQFRDATRRPIEPARAASLAARLAGTHGPAFRFRNEAEIVPAALEVYYYRYHTILRAIELGTVGQLRDELNRTDDHPLVAPMPGYEVFVAIVRGWLGEEAARLAEPLRAAWPDAPARGAIDQDRRRLAALGRHFTRHPARLALVTASIRFEAHATMRQVLRLAARRAADWPLPAQLRDAIARRFARREEVFDAFICAADACEHRLKPHPDLYQLAIAELGLPRAALAQCVGLEDSEPGIVALRAAGIGCAVALPNRDTRLQRYVAAAAVVEGGLPALVLEYNLLTGVRL